MEMEHRHFPYCLFPDGVLDMQYSYYCALTLHGDLILYWMRWVQPGALLTSPDTGSLTLFAPALMSLRSPSFCMAKEVAGDGRVQRYLIYCLSVYPLLPAFYVVNIIQVCLLFFINHLDCYMYCLK